VPTQRAGVHEHPAHAAAHAWQTGGHTASGGDGLSGASCQAQPSRGQLNRSEAIERRIRGFVVLGRPSSQATSDQPWSTR
jgi:hypothetical protein